MRDESEAALQVAWEAWHADNDDTLCFPGFVFRAAFKAGWAARTPGPDVARLMTTSMVSEGTIPTDKLLDAASQAYFYIRDNAPDEDIEEYLLIAVAEVEAAQSSRSTQAADAGESASS